MAAGGGKQSGGSAQRIGLMGGTFDPIHVGHLLLAEAALDELSLDGVLFMPTGRSYLKEGRKVAEREDRLRMTKLAIAGNPRFCVSRMEIDRPGNTYTADTLRALHEQAPENEWFLIMGADSYLMLDRWVRPQEICALATLVCADRDIGAEQNAQSGARSAAPMAALAAQERLLAERFGAKSEFLTLGRMDISSSAIRERIAAGKSVRYLLRDEVIRYIEENGLYRRS